MNIKHLIITVAILLVVVAVFGAASYALNLYTGPIIADRNAGAANERLDAVMPEGNKAYEDITATLTLPEKFVSPANNKRTAEIIAVHKEVNGLGYVVEVAWTSEDSHGNEPNLVLVGISTDGKIIKINNEAYHDTDNYNIFNKDPNYTTSFEGQDSTLADVGLVAGSTHSSESFRSAVAHAFEVLVINDMITAGKKSDTQILEEMIPTVTEGYGKLAEINVSGNIAKAMKAENGAGMVYIITEGNSFYLAIVNATGVCKVYDVDANDVTASHEAVVAEAKAHAAANQTDFYADLTTRLEKIMAGATEVTPIEINTFNTVVSAATFKLDGASYYAIYARSIGWASRVMDIYVVFDENGAIAKIDAKEFVFEIHDFEEYGGFAGMPNGYTDNFVGVTPDTWTGDEAIISGATMSTNAIKEAVEDIFNTFKSIKGGAQ